MRLEGDAKLRILCELQPNRGILKEANLSD